MWAIASEPIQRTYHSQILSRSFFLSAICCLLSFIIPILILVSIGYSWVKYEQVLLFPNLTYQHHQATCFQSDGTFIYDSSLSNQITSKSYSIFLSVNSNDNTLAISGVITSTTAVSCSFLIYFMVTLNVNLTIFKNNYETLAVLPLQFAQSSSSGNLAQVIQKGSIYTKFTSALPQSSVISQSMINYYTNNTQVLSMIDTHIAFNQGKNLSLFANLQFNQITYSASSSTINYLGQFQVPSQTFLQETPLLTNIRTFVPYFIYLLILFWIFLARPTIRWMLENKIYQAKVARPKIKNH